MKTHRKKTHCFQKPLTALETAIKKFNSSLWHIRANTDFQHNDIATMDQTPLLFVLQDKRTSNLEQPNSFINPIGSWKVLITTNHKAQQKDHVKALLKKKNISLCNVPTWGMLCTKVADVMGNKPFKDGVRPLFENHLDNNLEHYIEGKTSAHECIVLMINWVGEAWSKVKKMKDHIISLVEKGGLSVALDGSKNDHMSIKGKQNYQMAKAFCMETVFTIPDNYLLFGGN